MRLALLFAALAASLSRDAALGAGSIFLAVARHFDALATKLEDCAPASWRKETRQQRATALPNGSIERRILPDRRQGILIATQFCGLDYTIQFGPISADPREIFISCSKPGSASEAIARDAAILASLALQHGAPFDLLRNGVTRGGDGGGAAATIIGHALDLISREAGVRT